MEYLEDKIDLILSSYMGMPIAIPELAKEVKDIAIGFREYSKDYVDGAINVLFNHFIEERYNTQPK